MNQAAGSWKTRVHALYRSTRSVLGDYFRFILYSVAPATMPYGLVVAVTDRVSEWAEVVAAESIFMFAIGLCGNLAMRAAAIERKDDRRTINGVVFLTLLASAVAFGLVVVDPDPTSTLRLDVAVLVALLAAGPIAFSISVKAVKPGKREGLEQRNRSTDDLLEEILDLTRSRPELAAKIKDEL